MEYLYEHPGATAQEMTEVIRVDKATLTKTMKKLAEIGYLNVVGDERDHRVKHLYLTEKAVPAAKQIKKIHADFYGILSEGISPQGLLTAEEILWKTSINGYGTEWRNIMENNETIQTQNPLESEPIGKLILKYTTRTYPLIQASEKAPFVMYLSRSMRYNKADNKFRIWSAYDLKYRTNYRKQPFLGKGKCSRKRSVSAGRISCAIKTGRDGRGR